MNNFKFIKIFTLVLVTLLHFDINAQGETTLLEGHHLAAVVLTSYGSTLTSKMPLKYAIPNRAIGEIPGHIKDYFEDDIKMGGIMSEAALAIDWWTLFGEPTEQYIFTWLASDYYALVVPSKYGVIEKTVSKSMLQKYPDLLMRFEALKPVDIAFEIYWTFTDETRNSYYEQTGFFFERSFSNKEFKTKVSSASILTEPSGKVPFAVPGIRQGKGREFFGLPDDYPEDKLESLLKLFAKASSFWIYKVEVTKIVWPIHEMKAILDLYERYEKGEVDPSPIQIITEELNKSQNLTTYNNNDFWGEAYKEEKVSLNYFTENGKKGIKNEKGRVIIPPIYYDINSYKQETIFIASSDLKKHQRPRERASLDFPSNTVIYTNKGKELFKFPNSVAYVLEKSDCLFVRNLTNAFVIDLKTNKTIFNVAYEHPYTTSDYFHGINIPSDIVSKFVVKEYVKANCGGNKTLENKWGCGTISNTHVYGINSKNEVRFLGTYK